MTRLLPRAGALGLAGVFGVLSAGACGSTQPTGQLMVTIQTDMSITKDFDRFRLDVFAHDDRVVESSEHPVGRGAVLIPASIGIVAGKEDPRVRVRVIAIQGTTGRVYREIVTTVPEDRIALLRMPIQWLCDGSAQPVVGAPDAFIDACPIGQTCNSGSCVTDTIDVRSLPDYSPELVFGGGDETGAGGTCFETEQCFDSGGDVEVDLANCRIAHPGGDQVNVAVVPADGSGICGKQGCYIAIDKSEEFGWFDLFDDEPVATTPIGEGGAPSAEPPTGAGGTVGGGIDDPGAGDEPSANGDPGAFRSPPRRTSQEGDPSGIQLPPGLCEKIADGLIERVRVTTACETKGADVPACGDWSPVGPGGPGGSPDGGVEDDSGQPPDASGGDSGRADAGESGCGNGVIDPGEDCDPGDTEPGDGCDENCLLEPGAVLCPGDVVCPEVDLGDSVVSGTFAGCCPEGAPFGSCGVEDLLSSVTGARGCTRIGDPGAPSPGCFGGAPAPGVTECCLDGICGLSLDDAPGLGCAITEGGPSCSSSDGGVGISADLGKACTSDLDCNDSRLTCITDRDEVFNGESPPGGICTADCVGDPGLCTTIDPNGVCVDFGGGTELCMERCSYGPMASAVFDPDKCHGRLDVACAPSATPGQPFCLPRCGTDADCSIDSCNPVTGFCTSRPPMGLPFGSPCDPMNDQCAGTCSSIPLGTGPGTVDFCGQTCVAGSDQFDMPQCGHDGIGPGIGLCGLTFPDVTDNGGPGFGDLGGCVPMCDCDLDCPDPDMVCQPGSQLGRAGACVPRLDPTGAPVSGIPCPP